MSLTLDALLREINSCWMADLEPVRVRVTGEALAGSIAAVPMPADDRGSPYQREIVIHPLDWRKVMAGVVLARPGRVETVFGIPVELPPFDPDSFRLFEAGENPAT